MIFKNKVIFLLIAIFAIQVTTNAQKWTITKDSNLDYRKEDRNFIPNKYQVYQLDIQDMRDRLLTVPLAKGSKKTDIIISLPNNEGKFTEYKVHRQDVFHPKLAERYPEIQAYSGTSIQNSSISVKISMSQKGMDAMVTGGESGDYFIDRYAKSGEDIYMTYLKQDLTDIHKETFVCGVEDPNDGYKPPSGGQRYGDCMLRTYKLALTCTGEYSAFHGGTIPSVLAEYNTAINRVNQIYERDAAISLQLIENTDTLIFLDAISDPFQNDSPGAMIDQTPTVIDQLIGFNNYDIGHSFSTGAGGLASLRSPCTNRKARGVTGIQSPINDAFYIDYVAHEMGHQFGGNHTFNNSCNENRSNLTAVEPGSGSTIMAYAGICMPNVQNNSNAYFHTLSLREIANFVVAGNGGCAVETPLDNNSPEIPNNPDAVTIPGGTPFILDIEATDEDTEDVLTYTWEQMDIEIADMPPETDNTGGPTFRSVSPSINSYRYFPRLTSILDGSNENTWEVLPRVDREINFTITVRDNAANGGCTDYEELTIDVDGSAGPFSVIEPDNTTIWTSGGVATVTWDVANTDMAPVSCETVDIYLAIGEDRDFSILLAEGVPNDGEQEIIVPNEATVEARVMVRCATSVFFDINNGDFTIVEPFSLMMFPEDLHICNDEGDITYQLEYIPNGTFSEEVHFEVSGLPDGVTASFSDNDFSVNSSFTLTLSNFVDLVPGQYTVQINGTSATAATTNEISFFIALPTNEQAIIIEPNEGSRNHGTVVPVSWNDIDGNEGYNIQLSKSPAFTNLIEDEILLNNNYVFVGLEPSTVYYWRVHIFSRCYEVEYLDFHAFQTGSISCNTYMNTDSIEITEEDNNILTSTISIPETGNADMINVSLEIDHSFIGDLTSRISAPSGHSVNLFSRPGEPASSFGCTRDNIKATFTDAAMATYEDFEATCEPDADYAIEGTYRSEESLESMSTQSLEGDWVLQVSDLYSPDGGALRGWSLEVCNTGDIPESTLLHNETLLLDNTATELITLTHLEAETADASNTLFTIRSLPMNGTIQTWDTAINGFVSLALGGKFSQSQLQADEVRYQYEGSTEETDVVYLDLVVAETRSLFNIPFNININIGFLTGSATISNAIKCHGGTDGAITLMGVGGVQPYTYSIDGITYQESNTFEGLLSGSYTGYIKDSEDTVEEVIVVVPEPAILEVEADIQRDQVTLVASGGTGTFLYSSDGLDFQESNVFLLSNLTTYTMVVKDELGCTSTDLIDINYLESYDVETTDILCVGDMGRIEFINIVGGPLPYLYQVDDVVQGSPIFENITGGGHSVKVTDADNNEILSNVFITAVSQLVASADTLISMVTIDVTGGTAPYTYLLEGGVAQEENVFDNLENGTYEVTITDANDCIVTVAFEITNSRVSTSFLSDIELSLYPNPSMGTVIIVNNTEHEIRTIEILTINGTKLNELPYNERVDISSLPSGNYIFNFIGENIIGRKRIVKINR